MQVDIALEDATVVVLGEPDASRQALARYRRAGARIAFFGTPAHFMAAASVPPRPALVALVGSRPQGLREHGAHDGGWSPVLDHYRRIGVPLVTEPAAGRRGQVTLVGGGPGSRGLLTVDALEALRDADVVLFDRLAPWRALESLTTARLVDVGKLPGHHKVPQEEINRLIVDCALGRAGGSESTAGGSEGTAGGSESTAGRPANVVRLKGGDPFVFGRGAEEAAACAEAGVPVRVVSGISSAIAVPAAAGIPVTQRQVSHSFTVISGHAPLSDAEHLHLAGLAAGGGTVVVLMGVANLPHLASGLRRSGLSPDMPLAVVERGHLPGQRTTVTALGSAEADAAGCANPAVIVIGEVVRAGASNTGFGTVHDLAEALIMGGAS